MNKNYSKNNHCECGKLICNTSVKCISCTKKELMKNPLNNPNYNDGRTFVNFCIDCGIKIKRQTTRCEICENKHHSLLMRGKGNSMYGKTPLWIRVKYKGINMRSSWEVAYAKYLDRNKVKWLYEPKTFDLGGMTYTPDFYLIEKEIYIEIKGYLSLEGKNKINLFRKNFSNLNLLVYRQNHLRRMKVLK